MEELLSELLSVLAIAGAIGGYLKARAETSKIRAEAEARRVSAEAQRLSAEAEAEAARDKAIAEANKTIVAAASASVQNLINPLNFRIGQLEKALEDLTFEHYKLYIAFLINIDHMHEIGIDPLVQLVDLDEWDSKTLVDLAKERSIKLPRRIGGAGR